VSVRVPTPVPSTRPRPHLSATLPLATQRLMRQASVFSVVLPNARELMSGRNTQREKSAIRALSVLASSEDLRKRHCFAAR
jgi:hypothetical protein